MTDVANRIFQVGIEASGTPGTPVVATREWYGSGSVKEEGGEPVMRVVERASYDANHQAERGIENFSWEFEGGLDLNDIIEQLLLSVKRGVTPTQPSAGPDPTVYTWTFAPDNTAPATATLCWDAAGDVYVSSYAMADSIELSGGVSGGDVSVKLSGPSKDLTPGSAITAITDITNRIVQGWELQLYIDAFGGTPFTTLVDAQLLSWSVSLKNDLSRFRGASNSRFYTRLNRGRRMVESKFVIDLASTGLAERVKKRAATKVLVGLRIGNNDLISNTYNKKLDLIIPGAYTTSEIGEDAGSATLALGHRSVYDPTNAYAFKALVQNTRAT